MIFVTEKDFHRQLTVIDAVNVPDTEIVIWAYPEATIEMILGLPLHHSESVGAEAVTTYPMGAKARCTERTRLTSALRIELEMSGTVIGAHCDSICLYEKNKFTWIASIVGHEGMVLVRNASLLKKLEALNFSASTSPPDWW